MPGPVWIWAAPPAPSAQLGLAARHSTCRAAQRPAGLDRAGGAMTANHAPDEVDLVVIGGGPAGENLADYATRDSGLSAVLVEEELLGGECSYWACMPSKALLRPIEVRETASHLPGISTPQLQVDELLRRRDDWVAHYDDAGQVGWAESVGIPVVRGTARLVGERVVEVHGPDGVRRITARRAVALATGSVPVVPELYAGVHAWGSRDVTGVVEIPERLAIVGGGVVACEAAVWMNALGARVTMLVRGERLLAPFEPFAGEAVLTSLRGQGVDVRLNTQVTSCRRDAPAQTGIGHVHGGPVYLGIGEAELVADELLLALGRRPRLSGLGLERVGVTSQDVIGGSLPDWLLAVGDASGEPALTHWGKYRGRVLGERLAAEAQGRPRPVVPDVVPVPQVVFTMPQVASVGLTQAQAQREGRQFTVSQVPFTSAAGAALLQDDATGEAMLMVDSSGVLLGATFVGPEVAELVHAATVAIVGAVPVPALRHAVPSYPTASELWLRLLEALPG
ncbi:MAG: dihydrolipoyl dehydrogenase family protein [Actinomycetales bacterium]